MDTRNTNLHYLQEFTSNDVISSFLYASAVNVILAQGVLKTDLTSVIALGTIVFLFIDWLSRVTIPISFPEDDQKKRRETRVKLSKAGLEILLIFSLVTTCMHYINPPASLDVIINSKKSFSFFLFASFLWNILMLYVMTLVKFTDLAKSIFLGTAYDIEGARIYTQRLNSAIKSAEDSFVKSSTLIDATTLYTKLKRHYLTEGFVRTIAQVVANHFTWISLFVGIVLFFELEVDFNNFGHFIIYDLTISYSIIILSLLFVVPIYIFYKICHISKKSGKNLSSNCSVQLKIVRIFAAIFILLFFIFFYLAISHTLLIVVMLLQQTIVGLFLRYAIPAKVENVEIPDLTENK